jgi:hypothetical protein
MRPIDTYTLADGETIIYRQHNVDTCPCEECETLRWQQVEQDEVEFGRRVSVTVDVEVPEEVAEDENPDPWGHLRHDRDDAFWNEEDVWFE